MLCVVWLLCAARCVLCGVRFTVNGGVNSYKTIDTRQKHERVQVLQGEALPRAQVGAALLVAAASGGQHNINTVTPCDCLVVFKAQGSASHYTCIAAAAAATPINQCARDHQGDGKD